VLEEESRVEEETGEEEIEESSGIPSSGGGGAGSSSRRDTYGLIVGDKLTVIINGESHTITITEVRESSATFLIKSVAIEVELDVGETKEIDLNNDGLPDMGITLEGVSELRKITITVEDLTQREDEVEEIEDSLDEEQPEADPLERITGAVIGIDTQKIEEVSKDVRETTTAVVKYVIFANVIAGILVGSMVAAREIKRRRMYNVFHQQTKQEVVDAELEKLRQYAAAAMKNGRNIYDIKSDLLEAGWFEYEVDEALVDTMLKEKAGFNQMK
jgi:macrodomain Ter protein organizer (MatP/YcbG family)